MFYLNNLFYGDKIMNLKRCITKNVMLAIF